MVDSLLLCAARVSTFSRKQYLSSASGFFFERDGRLFLVTNRHVIIDKPNNHFPDALEIELHINATNLTESIGFSIPLYNDQGKSLWRQATDASGDVDVAVIELERAALPPGIVYRAFGVANLYDPLNPIEIGSQLLVVGFPLGFHDTLHHLPLVRQAVCASAFGLRFQGKGYFIADARTHRSSSGAPVVMRSALPNSAQGDLPWILLGVHSARIDIVPRDLQLDEALGLNCVWYADILLELTRDK